MSHLPYDADTTENQERQAADRKGAALLLLTTNDGAVDMMLLASALGVEAELDELAGDDEKRQQKIADARTAAAAQLDGWLNTSS
jgi:hypothetical protein